MASADKKKDPNVFLTYRWHWWVIVCNFRGSFNDVRAEAIAALLILAQMPTGEKR